MASCLTPPDSVILQAEPRYALSKNLICQISQICGQIFAKNRLFHAESFTVAAVQTAPGRDALLNSILLKLSLSACPKTNWVPWEQGEFAHKSSALIVKQTCCSLQSKLRFGLGNLSTHEYVSGYSLTEYQHLPFHSPSCWFGLFCWDFLWPRAKQVLACIIREFLSKNSRLGREVFSP